MRDEILQGRYAIERQLRKHAGRQTLLARDLATQELVVIKLLTFGNDFEWQDLKLFAREAQILQELSHPAIPCYLDYFELNLPDLKGFALVQTYIPARSLSEHLQAGRTFSEVEVKQIAKALLEVLIYLHERLPPVIHRDLKASNVLLGAPRSGSLRDRSGEHVGQVYLVDFGSVRGLSDGSSESCADFVKTAVAQQDGSITVVGTYGYMPPEQFGGRAVPATDLYGLGATLIHLVTGSHPADLLQDDMKIQFEQLVNLSPAFLNWLKWLTEPSLKRRSASAREALQALDNLSSRQFSLVVCQPEYSRIQLVKQEERLEITIPPAGFSFRLGFLCGFDLIWLSVLINWTISVWGEPSLILFPIFHWAFGIWIFLAILFTLFGKIRFCLTPEKISLTYELLGLKYTFPRPGQRQDIDKLEVVERQVVRSRGAIKERVKGSVPSQLVIWTVKRKYVLGRNAFTQWLRISRRRVLHASELDWLAQELSDWLELPISRK
ncbi:MAG: serine/threonine-protein kinase [Xenococcaceae cyanobacterium MO_188.B29]|nr:serine/threonine-protein kinase [Xenococcaceae cyanobacterium MO_188.B29]